MRAFFLLLLFAPALVAGCKGQEELLAGQSQTIDSLYVIERTLRAELFALQDSIRFYDEIDSGLYYRQQRTLEDRINKLEYLLAARRDTLCRMEHVGMLRVDELFKPASAELSEEGIVRLDTLAAHLDAAYPNRIFRVEGHTDNVPVGPKLQEQYPSNWELSAARATSVVRHFVESLDMGAARFEVVGFGPSRPTDSNGTAEGRRRNRRITILVLPE